MRGYLFAIITLTGWGTWLAPVQNVEFPNQQIKTFYVVVTNLVIATLVALWLGSIAELNANTFWLTLLGGVIWAIGGLCAFTATSKIGMAKEFGIWAPLNIVVSLMWGALLFREFVDMDETAVFWLLAAILIILVGVLLIIFAKGDSDDSQPRGDFWLGLAGAVGAGILWGSYFIPVKYSGVSAWAGAFPLAIGMMVGGTALALLSRQSLKLAKPSDYGRASLSGGLWSLGNYGVLLMVGVMGAGRGFTIAQLSVVVGALTGIYWLHDPAPRTRAARLTLAGCVLATIGGVILGNLN